MSRIIAVSLVALAVTQAAANEVVRVSSSFKIWPQASAHIPATGVSDYSLTLPPGPQQLMARYPTFSGDVDCRFEWTAQAGEVYEITDMNQAQPLTLFRLEAVGNWYHRRRDALLPSECIGSGELK